MSLIFGVVEGDNQEIRNQVRGERAIRIDKSTRSTIIIPQDHHEVHGGTHFHVETYNDNLASGAAINIVVTTPDTNVEQHLVFFCRATAAVLFEMYITPTVTGGTGSAVTPSNRNRRSVTTSVSTVRTGMTVTNAGTLLTRIYLGQGASVTQGAESRGIHEWILNRNTTYLFRATSQAQDNEAHLEIDWYEHTPRS